jgi:hypothetical protein
MMNLEGGVGWFLYVVEGKGDETVRRGNGVDDYYETRCWLQQSTLVVNKGRYTWKQNHAPTHDGTE